jgi:hypothetical protein
LYMIGSVCRAQLPLSLLGVRWVSCAAGARSA